MKRIIIVAVLVLLLLPVFCQEYKIIDSKLNKTIKLREMAEKLGSYDVIFFGEYHDNKILHSLEIELLKLFYSNNKNLVISMEMFERDVQMMIDKYLNEDISEEEFLAESRPWPNYQSDYKPLLEFAKKNKLNVIAANIPRRYASMISKQGMNALDSLSQEEKKFIAKKHKVFNDEYKERFTQTMKNNMAHRKMPMSKQMNLDLIYAAQCIKDDTMAESILKYQRIPPRRKVIHYNGDFHSRGHLGTAQKIKLLEPMLKIAVIAPVMCEGEYNWDEEDLKEGDFLILLIDETEDNTMN